MAKITLFHTSDMHNKLNEDYARRLHELKASVPGSLMFDSGDAIWAGNAFWRPGGEPVFDLMNSVPYDALCVGNREFHFMQAGMKAKTAKANFPCLSANLRVVKPRRHLPAKPYVTFDREEIRIGVMGLTVPCITERMLVKKISDYYFVQPEDAARDVVNELRGDCDLIIALTHIGIKQDRELAEKVSGIDLILGGHTHTVTADPERVEDTWILHHGFYVHYVGKVEIEIDSGGIKVKSELIPLAKA